MLWLLMKHSALDMCFVITIIFIIVLFIEDTDFLRITDDESVKPQINDNIGIASPEEMDRERGLHFFQILWFTKVV